MRRARFALVGVCIGLLTAEGLAQVPAGDKLAFEAASVKRNESGSTNGGVGLRPGGYLAANTLLRTMIVHAYHLKPLQVVGGPDWIGSDRFDVQARAAQGSSDDDLFQMVQTLLAERFKLVVHHEVRELPIYALVRVRADGKLGPRLRPSASDCSAGTNPCGMYATSYGDRGGTITTKSRTLDDLALSLGGMLDRTVANRTELDGRYEMDLSWGGDSRTAPSMASNSAPMVFTAIQEQLGLKLEPSRGPVDVLVIDHVEHPAED